MIASEPCVRGEIVLYRLFEIGYEVDLDRAGRCLAPNESVRMRPTRGEAQAIQIANPPLTVALRPETITVGAHRLEGRLSARLFDFGVASLRLHLPVPASLSWREFTLLGQALLAAPPDDIFPAARDELCERIRPAILRAGPGSVTEEYAIFRLHGLEPAAGEPPGPESLSDTDISRLLLGETRPLSASAVAEMMSPRLSYFADDVTVITWNAALVLEPNPADSDVEYVLEFANAQLLELRWHDRQLDEELPRIYDEVAAARRAFRLLGRRFSRLLGALQTRVADVTESVERAENSLKVTDDVFLARIYTTALDTFRGPTWRRGIDRKMSIVRDTYSMLNAESQALRTEILELIIVLLIVLEIVMAFWK
jgi:hypothetical protein